MLLQILNIKMEIMPVYVKLDILGIQSHQTINVLRKDYYYPKNNTCDFIHLSCLYYTFLKTILSICMNKYQC